MGMPEQPQSGMNIAPDGTVYEILDDGTIKRIGKVSPDGSFEPFCGTKDGIREKNGIIYRVINGKEVKIGRILPNGEIETINQRIKSEAEVSRNKVKIVTILSILIALAIGAGLYIFDEQQQTKEELRKADEERRLEKEKEEEYENKIRPVYAKYLEEKSPTSEKLGSYITQLNNIMKLGLRHKDNKKKLHEIMGEIEKKKGYVAKLEAAKAQAEEQKRQEAKKREYLKGRKIGNLIWSDHSLRAMNWNKAKQYCEALTEGGFNDWRLPTISELRTTIKNCSGSQSGGSCRVSDNCLDSNCWSKDCYCEDRQNNGGYYSKLGDDDNVRLCSSSVLSGTSNIRWGVGFGKGVVNRDSVGNSSYVRCVRAAQ